MDRRLDCFFDLDDTILSSNQQIRNLYMRHFNASDPGEIVSWNGKSQLQLAPEGWLESIFDSEEFFDGLRIKDGVFDILQNLMLDGRYNLFVASIGKRTNIKCKIDYLYRTGLDIFFNDLIFNVKTSPHHEVQMGKGFLTDNSLMLDDNMINLKHAKYRILFNDGLDKEWNKDYKGLLVRGWDDDLLLKIEDCYYDFETGSYETFEERMAQ